MEVRAFDAVEFKSTPEGTFRALICSFDRPDKAGDVVRRGAFAATIQHWRSSGHVVPVIFSHAWKDPQQFIGEVDPGRLVETDVGVEVSGRLYLDEPNGAKVFKQLQRKTLNEWSFGYIVTKAKQLAAGTRELLSVDLLELGPCLSGVGDTMTLGVKANDIRAALDAHRQALVAVQLDPYRAQLDLARRRMMLDRVMRA